MVGEPGAAVDDRPGDPSTKTWASRPLTPRRFQAVWVCLALLVLPLGLLATVLRVFPAESEITALLASFVSYGTLAYAASLLCLLIAVVRARRGRVLAALSALATVTAVLLGCHLAWLAPFFVEDDRPAATAPFTVMSLNMLGGAADSRQLLEQAASADVVVLLEATPPALWALKDLGWDQRFPHHSGDPDDSDAGTAIYSRYPLSDRSTLARTSFPQRVATTAVPGIGAVRILAVHPCNPFCGVGTWAEEHRILRAAAADNMDLPLVVAGDFNAVDDHLPLRQLRQDGLVSATDITGAGWLPTYPANRLIPPTIPIDHILLNSQLTATSISTFAVAGTDHLGLVATLAGTAQPAAGPN